MTGILLALVLSLLPVTAFSAQKITAGSLCKVVNQKITYKNVSFTCLKSGKKTIWSQTPKTATKPTPTPTPNYERKDWEIVYLKIWDEFNNAQNQGTFPFVYRLSPTVNQAKALESIAAYDKAMKPWLAILNGAEVSPVVWTIMSEKDYAWWKQVVAEQEKINPYYAWEPNTNILGHCGLSQQL